MKNIFIFLLLLIYFSSFAQRDSIQINDSVRLRSIFIPSIDTSSEITYDTYISNSDYFFIFQNDSSKFTFSISIDTLGNRFLKKTIVLDSSGYFYFSGKTEYLNVENEKFNYNDSIIKLRTFYFNDIAIIPGRSKKKTASISNYNKLSKNYYNQVYKNELLVKELDSVKIFLWNLSGFNEITYQKIDTTVLEFHIYNPEIRSDYTISYLGNIGQPSFNKRFINKQFTFLESHDGILYKSENTTYYNTKSPFTSFAYTMGPNKEQSLEVFHTQNINKNLNVGARYHNIGSEGLITQQYVKGNRFNVFTSFNSNIYSAYTSYTRNKFDWYENGGIIEDSYLVDSIDLSDDVDELNQIPINLENAKAEFLRNDFNLYHEINIGKSDEYWINDSLTKTIYRSKFSVAHYFNYDNYFKKYEDFEDSTIFYTNNFNNAGTFDSVYYRNRLHGVGLKLNNLVLRNNIISSGIYYQQRLERYSFFNKDTLFNNSADTNIYSIELKGFFNYLISDKYTFNVNARYVLKGYYKGNLSSSLRLFKHLNYKDTSHIGLLVDYNINTPDYFLTNYASNHFKWNNNYAQYNMWESKFSLAYDRPSWFLNAKASATLIDNSIYFDSNANPQLNDSSFFVYSFELKKKFHLWKLVFSNKVLYQTSANESTISIPKFCIYQSTYFDDLIVFKKTEGKMRVQLGFDVFYNTSYYAPAYMPATGQFYQQRQNLYGDYPYVDVFLNLKIKRMRIFLKMRHVNEGYVARNYFATQNYPLYGRGFIFGFNWGFYD
jgi:Putative porin